MYWKQVWNKSQTYFDGRFNSGAFFIYLTVRPSTDGKRAPLTAINLQAAGSPQQAPPTYIAKMWKLIKFIKNVIFWRNHTYINPDDWTITKKTIRTTIHENFSKMKNSKVDRCHRPWSTLAQIVASCLLVASNYTKQCWLDISAWQSHKCNFTQSASTINYQNQIENYMSEISFRSPRGPAFSSAAEW